MYSAVPPYSLVIGRPGRLALNLSAKPEHSGHQTLLRPPTLALQSVVFPVYFVREAEVMSCHFFSSVFFFCFRV